MTGDLKASRRLEDRAKVQESLKTALQIVNTLFSDDIVAKFVIVRGDSFQGMLSSPGCLFDVYFELFDKIGHQFYLGIGIGEIATSLSANVGEIDGEAFHKSSEALERAKRAKLWIVFMSGWEIDRISTCLLNLMADVMWDWTARQREIVAYYRRLKKERGNVTLAEVVRDIGIKKQTLSMILKRSRYKLLAEAERAFADFISRKWQTGNNKP